MTREEILQIAKPILFNTDMVRAILDDRKSVTRRVLKLPPYIKEEGDGLYTLFADGTCYENQHMEELIDYIKSPYKKGDYLYVRETWSELSFGYVYKAHGDKIDHLGNLIRWRPSIHMPKEAARIFLRVKDVRVERLQDITEEQAIREGIRRLYDHLSDDEYSAWKNRTHINAQKSEWGWKNYLWHGHFGKHGTGNAISNAWEYQYSSYDDPRDSFSSLWNSTLSLNQWDEYGWDANPWVWVIEFERVEV